MRLKWRGLPLLSLRTSGFPLLTSFVSHRVILDMEGQPSSDMERGAHLWTLAKRALRDGRAERQTLWKAEVVHSGEPFS